MTESLIKKNMKRKEENGIVSTITLLKQWILWVKKMVNESSVMTVYEFLVISLVKWTAWYFINYSQDILVDYERNSVLSNFLKEQIISFTGISVHLPYSRNIGEK